MKQVRSNMIRSGLFLLLVTQSLQAQEIDHAQTRFWVTAGYGKAFGNRRVGKSFGGLFTFNPDWITITARYSNAQIGELISLEAPPERLKEFSVLIGISKARDPVYFGIAVGPGLVLGNHITVRATKRFSVLSASLGGHYFYRLAPSVALGLYAFGNLNGEQSYFGFWITLNVGFFREY